MARYKDRARASLDYPCGQLNGHVRGVSDTSSYSRSTSSRQLLADNSPDSATGLPRSRSNIQVRDLRDQLSELRGKVSTLREKTKRDDDRRPSPLIDPIGLGLTIQPSFIESDNPPSSSDGFPTEPFFDDSPESIQAEFSPATPDDNRSPAPRHEDRSDAFDYQHFFLHSRAEEKEHSRPSSASTERPASPGTVEVPLIHAAALSDRTRDSLQEDIDTHLQSGGQTSPQQLRGGENRHLAHSRHHSASSISTMATFATADEGEEEEDDPFHLDSSEGGTPRQSFIDPPSPETPLRKGPPTSQNGQWSRGTPQSDALNLLAHIANVHESVGIPAADKRLDPGDEELVTRVVHSLARVCRDLHILTHERNSVKQYESKICRRKLDAARRHLDGEVHGEAF